MCYLVSIHNSNYRHPLHTKISQSIVKVNYRASLTGITELRNAINRVTMLMTSRDRKDMRSVPCHM